MIHHTTRFSIFNAVLINQGGTLSEKLRKLRKPSFSFDHFEEFSQLTLLRKQLHEELKTKIALYVL